MRWNQEIVCFESLEDQKESKISTEVIRSTRQTDCCQCPRP